MSGCDGTSLELDLQQFSTKSGKILILSHETLNVCFGQTLTKNYERTVGIMMTKSELWFAARLGIRLALVSKKSGSGFCNN